MLSGRSRGVASPTKAAGSQTGARGLIPPPPRTLCDCSHGSSSVEKSSQVSGPYIEAQA